MKKLMLLCSMLVVLGTACKKESSTTVSAAEQAAADDAQIQAYIKANGITATKDASGLYYQVITPGSGAYPTSSSTVNVNYNGKFLDGTSFDSGNYNNSLSGVIQGWQIGVPKINTGGRILLLIPSALAYGPSGRGTIPANKVLMFTVDLLSFR